jgi:hypothetical protein
MFTAPLSRFFYIYFMTLWIMPMPVCVYTREITESLKASSISARHVKVWEAGTTRGITLELTVNHPTEGQQSSLVAL